MEPSCLLGLANSHLLFERCAEGLQIRFEESNVSAHHAEMGNLLSLYPKIHCLDADAKVHRSVANRQGEFLTNQHCHCASALGLDSGEVLLIHALLYGIRAV